VNLQRGYAMIAISDRCMRKDGLASLFQRLVEPA
jgi:hypothetical protein